MTRLYNGGGRQMSLIPKARSTNYAGRGMEFERALEQMHEVYKARGIGIITKNYVKSTIVGDGKLARVDGSAIVDYTGCLEGGSFVAFDAKDCESKSIALSRLQPHQLEYLTRVWKHGGEAFILARFERRRCWRIPVLAWMIAEEYRETGAHAEGFDGFKPTGKASINEKELPEIWMVEGYDWANARRRR